MPLRSENLSFEVILRYGLGGDPGRKVFLWTKKKNPLSS
jgi:hypothetical protein